LTRDQASGFGPCFLP